MANVSGCLLWLVFNFTSFFLPIFLHCYQARGEKLWKNTIKLKCVTAQSGRDCESMVKEGGVSEGDDSYQAITCRFYVMMESMELCVSEEPADTNSKHKRSSLLSATCYIY